MNIQFEFRRLAWVLLVACGSTWTVFAVGAAIQAAPETSQEASKDAGSGKSDSVQNTVEVKTGDLTLNVPSHWKQETPKSRLRLAQFRIPAVEGDSEDAELAVFTFGGGSVEANVRRWIDQFQPEGRVVKTSQGESAPGKYVLVELRGTYNRPIGPPIQRKTKPAPNSRMVGVILEIEKKGVFYLKVTGPDKTVAAESAALRATFGGDAEKEKKLTTEGDG